MASSGRARLGAFVRRQALALWLVGVVAAAAVSWRTNYVADLSAFLPRSPSPEQAVLLDQLRTGIAARLVLIGIEGGTPEARTEASLQLAGALRGSGAFEAVHNGDNTQFEATGKFLFEHRYLLSPAVDAQRFSVDGLRAAIDETTSLLGTPAGALVKAVILRDPTGETLRMAETMLPAQSPRSDGRVWVSRDASRAVLLATTRADGADLDAQQRALELVQTSFAQIAGRPSGNRSGDRSGRQDTGENGRKSAQPATPASARQSGPEPGQQREPASRQQATRQPSGQADRPADGEAMRLVVSGSGSFAVASRTQIKAEVERLAIAGGVAIVALLLLAFGGSVRTLLTALLPVATGVLGGIAAVSLVFGNVHGITLGFGTTLIGEAVDYAIYYLIQARPAAGRLMDRITGAGGDATAGAPAGATAGAPAGSMARSMAGSVTGSMAASTSGPPPGSGARHWIAANWPTVRLGLWTSVCGFAALLFSGFPGLAQLGVFSIAGLTAAALTTRWVFTVLAPDGAPGMGLRRHLGRAVGWCTAVLPRLRWPLAALALAAAVALAWLPSPWRGDLASLSPVGAEKMRIDAELRADLGATDGGTLVAVSATDEAGALEQAEAVGRRLDRLVAAGALAGYESPARLLPSPAVQLQRQAALPDTPTLAARLAEATADGPLPARRLGGFINDVQAARAQPVLTRSALQGTPLAGALDALLVSGRPGSGDDARPWRALLSLQAGTRPIDPQTLRIALADVSGARIVSIKPELDALYARYLHEAMLQALLGALAVCALLWLHLRSWRRLLRIARPIAAAVLIVLAAFSAAGAALGILHLVGLLLTVAIGSNYALFFDQIREQAHAAQQAAGDTGDPSLSNVPAAPDNDTLASLALANLTAVISFCLLAWSNIPALFAIGQVVAPGIALSLLLSAAFIPPRRLSGLPDRAGAV